MARKTKPIVTLTIDVPSDASGMDALRLLTLMVAAAPPTGDEDDALYNQLVEIVDNYRVPVGRLPGVLKSYNVGETGSLRVARTLRRSGGRGTK